MSPTQLFLAFAAMLGAVVFLSFTGETGLSAADDSGVENSSGFSLSQIFGGPVDLMGEAPDKVSDPEKLRRPEFYGWKAKHPGVAAYGDRILLLRDIVSNYPREVQYPASYRVASFDPTCTPRPLGDGEALANVSVGRADLESGMLAFSTATLVKANLYWLEQNYKKSAYIDDEDIIGDHKGLPIVNVIVTDTSAPQYLVLQHWLGKVLWNVVPAPGVEIAHIAVIGPGAALSPPPGDYDVQFLSTRGSDCVPVVARNPRQTWEMFLRMDGVDKSEYEQKARTAFTTYDFWFRQHFKRSAEFDVVGFDTTQHALVGPVPETPIPYRPLTGADVLVTEFDYIFVAPPDVRDPFLMQAQLDMLTVAAGGDLGLLTPEPMLRETEEAVQ